MRGCDRFGGLILYAPTVISCSAVALLNPDSYCYGMSTPDHAWMYITVNRDHSAGVRLALRMLFGNSLCCSSGALGRLNAGELRACMCPV